MGNRAAVVFTDKSHKEISPAIYLHWNGGPESIYAFLDELRRRKCCGHSVSYAAARFAHVVGDFFDADGVSCLSLGMEAPPSEISPEGLSQLTNTAEDNGVFVVSPGDDKKFNVRRFVFQHDSNTAIELSKREVNRERKEAYQNPCCGGIAERLRQLRPLLEGDAYQMKRAEYLVPDTPLPIAADWFEEHGDTETAEKIRNAFRPN